jgi:hypothetical protein
MGKRDVRKTLPKDQLIVGGQVVPRFCECGGELEYVYQFERIWSACKKCTPVVKVDVPKLEAK